MKHKIQLFCFTHAGGNASFFDGIEKDLPDIEFVKLEYPGHGTRHKEPFCGSFDILADDVYSNIKKTYFGEEYALFGYSMGSITLVEVLKRVQRAPDMPLPCAVFMAAHEPQIKSELLDFNDDELDEWVKERTIHFGAVPEKLINNKSFWRMYLPLYRLDYKIIGKYGFEYLEVETKVPAVIFYSDTDTPLCDMKRWEKHFTGECEFFRFEGNHFFIHQHHEKMAAIIKYKLLGRGI